MKKGQQFEAVVEKTDFPNKGIVTIEDRKVVIKRAIEGQKVLFSLTKIRKDKCQGRLIEVTEPSYLEDTTSNCPHFEECGGCTYLTMSVDNQMKLKEKQVRSLLDSTGLEYEWEGISASPLSEGYRNKMEFTFGDEYKDGPLTLGMHKKNSFYDIVAINSCKIVSEDYNIIVQAVVDFCLERGYSFYKKIQHIGLLRHLVIRRAAKSKNLLINIVTSSQMEFDEDGFVGMLNELKLDGEIVGILHTINDSLADVVQADELRLLYGEPFFYEEILGLKFKISPFSFFQTNSLGAEVLYSKVREYVGDVDNKVVFDLYSGTGTIAQIAAKVATRVYGVEIVEEAVEAAKVNAKLNGIDNCVFIAGDVLKVIEEIEEKPDFIILDPPRAGINPKALDKIAAYGVDRIVYISCNPVSLANDLKLFSEVGYRLVKASCVDMFVGNPNVETVCLIEKCNLAE